MLCVNRSPDWAIWPNYEVMEFQPWSGIATVLDSATFIQLYYSLLPPHLFQPCSGSPSPPPPGPNSYCSPIFHPSTPLISLFAPAYPPQLARCGATIHLGGAPTCWPPPPVCASLPCWRPQGVTRASLWLPSLVRLPSLCRPRPAPRSLSDPGVLPSEGGSLPPSASLRCPHVCSPPCWSQPATQSPAGPEGFALCSSVPRPLCICLSLPVFRAVSWCLLEFNFPSDVLLC